MAAKRHAIVHIEDDSKLWDLPYALLQTLEEFISTRQNPSTEYAPASRDEPYPKCSTITLNWQGHSMTVEYWMVEKPSVKAVAKAIGPSSPVSFILDIMQPKSAGGLESKLIESMECIRESFPGIDFEVDARVFTAYSDDDRGVILPNNCPPRLSKKSTTELFHFLLERLKL